MHASPDANPPRRLVRNAASILATDAINRGATFVLYALVARYMGALEFGQLSLALALFYLWHVVAAAGLKVLVIRELARDRARTDAVLVNGSALVIACCGVSIVALVAFVRVMGYSRDTASLILLLSLGLFPAALSALWEGVFQAWEQMHLIAKANVPASLAKAAIAFAALANGCSLFQLAMLILLTQAAVAGTEWYLLRRYIARPRLAFDARASLVMLRSAAPFLAIDMTIAFWSSVQILLLSAVATEKEVGLYNAAVQLLIPVSLFFQAATQTLFPMMCRTFDGDASDLRRVAERLLAGLLAVAVPVSLVLFIVAGPALGVMYQDDEFLAAVPVLRILVWTVLLRAISQALGQVLLAGMRETVTLRIVVVNAVVSLTLGLLLIPLLGALRGAAVAALVASVVNAIQHWVPVSRLLGGMTFGRMAWIDAR